MPAHQIQRMVRKAAFFLGSAIVSPYVIAQPDTGAMPVGENMTRLVIESHQDLRQAIATYRILLEQRRYEEALPLVAKAFSFSRQHDAGTSLHEISTDYTLALLELGREAEAVEIFADLYESQTAIRTLDAVAQSVAMSAAGAGIASAIIGNSIDPTGIAVKALFVALEKSAPKPLEVVTHEQLRRMALMMIHAGRHAEALPFARRLVESSEELALRMSEDRVLAGKIGFHGTFNPHFAYLILASAYTGVGQHHDALKYLERFIQPYASRKADGSMGDTPGESYFSAGHAFAFNVYWPLKAKLLARVNQAEAFDAIVGENSQLSLYWKTFIKASIDAGLAKYADADKALTFAEKDLDGSIVTRGVGRKTSRQEYSHYSLACNVKLRLKDWHGASDVCSKAKLAFSEYIQDRLQSLKKNDASFAQFGQFLVAHRELAPEEFSAAPSLEVALEMANYYSGKQSRFIELLQSFLAHEEARRDHFAAINLETVGANKARQWAYKELMRIELRKGNFAEAFRFSENTKARLLINSANQRYAFAANILPEEDRKPLAQFEGLLAAQEERLAKEGVDADERLRLQTERDATLREYRSYKQNLYKRFPRFLELTRTGVFDAAVVKTAIPLDAAFVSYVMHQDEIFVFVIVNGKVQGLELGHHPELAARIGEVRALVASPKGNISTATSLHALSKVLIGALPAEALGKRRLIIAPDGALSLIPFEILQVGNEPLVAARDVSYVQSVTVLSVLQDRQRLYAALSNRRPLLAMGNPIYSRAHEEDAQAVRSKGGQMAQDVGASVVENSISGNVRGIFELAGIRWSPLPATGIEVTLIGKNFDGSAVYLGADASERTMKRLRDEDLLSSFRMLHFATHGYFNPYYPSLHSIILDQSGSDDATDGFVTMAELSGYNLRSDLVTLSACDTGLGQIVEGEGVMGLPYALTMAGNVTSVITLWPVADESTAEFMALFYTKLTTNVSVASALSATKRAFLKRPEYRPPFYWAPFISYGI